MNQKEIQKKLQELKTELAREQSAVASGTRPENAGSIKELRRAIARILTIQQETPAVTIKKDKEVGKKND